MASSRGGTMSEHDHKTVLCKRCGTVIYSCPCKALKEIMWEEGPCRTCRGLTDSAILDLVPGSTVLLMNPPRDERRDDIERIAEALFVRIMNWDNYNRIEDATSDAL